MKSFFKKAFMLPLILLIAVVIVVFQVKTKAPIQHESLPFATKTVEVITARQLPYRPRVTAYGYVEPAVILKMKSEVAGKITYIHPQLRKGGSLAKGTMVLRVEPTAFKFSLDQSRAGLTGSQSSYQQLEAEEKSAHRSLAIAQQNLRVGKQEYNRVRKIWDKRLIARSVVDAEERKVLQLRQQVEEIEGKIASFSSRKAATQAQIKQSKTKLAQSKDTLGRTEVTLPFDARIGTVFIEKGEFTPVGNALFEASGTNRVEIDAQLATQQLRDLLMGAEHQALTLDTSIGLQAVIAQLQLEARVTLVGKDESRIHWQAVLQRISEAVDPTRDTIGLVVSVENPYQGIIPGIRPPLLKGMYAAVEFIAPAEHKLVLPRKAIHQGRVYLANTSNQLEIRTVHILQSQGELVVVEGIEVGEKIIINDVIPVIEGMPLKLIHAEEVEALLAQTALGNPPHSQAKDTRAVDENNTLDEKK